MIVRSTILAAGICAFASTSGSGQGQAGAWHRGALPSGTASIETPCAPGEEQTLTRGGSEGIRCLEGLYEAGIIYTDGPSFANGAFGDQPFEGVRLALLSDPWAVEHEELTVLGRRAVRWVGQSSFGYGAMATVEMPNDTMILFRVRPRGEDQDAERLSGLLDRAIASLDLSEEGQD